MIHVLNYLMQNGSNYVYYSDIDHDLDGDFYSADNSTAYAPACLLPLHDCF